MAIGRPSATQNRRRSNWADLTDEGEEDFGFLLPQPVTTGPDKNGIKKVVEYKVNEDGKTVKVTTTTVIKSHLSEEALHRRSWAKFGDATNEDVGSRLTVASHEDIRIERPRPPESTSTKKQPGDGEVKCRNCSGNHWTVACPLPSQDRNNKQPETAPVPTNKSYVPPNLRGGDRPGQPVMNRRNEENSVKVSNLSEDTRDEDLRDLFGNFGPLSRSYVATDRSTGTSRGFGFVNFVHREDAERAINKLNGFGYDNLILSVEWAPPRKCVMFRD